MNDSLFDLTGKVALVTGGSRGGRRLDLERTERGDPMSPEPEGLDPTVTRREIVFEADVTSVTPFLKVATASRNNTGHMTFACDEGPNLGGLGSAPTPLMYFSAALAF